MKFTVDPWDPSYGTSNDLDPGDASKAQVDVDIEVPAAQWAPRRPQSTRPPERLVFVDGVRRVEAHVWIDADDRGAHHGLCASYAAGAVRCDGAAVCGPFIVRRGVFSAHDSVETIPTRHGEFSARQAASASPEGLALALQERMGAAELEAAEGAAASGDVDLVVVDGPLRGRQHLSGAVGYVKTHHVTYLPPELNAVVARLGPGERTPLFRLVPRPETVAPSPTAIPNQSLQGIAQTTGQPLEGGALGTDWSRTSWYFRLAATAGGSPWAGVVRVECSATIPVPEATVLADAVTAALPRFASAPHKDSRAPQNLYPIAGLERELRHRLGDPQLLYRALRVAAT